MYKGGAGVGGHLFAIAGSESMITQRLATPHSRRENRPCCVLK